MNCIRILLVLLTTLNNWYIFRMHLDHVFDVNVHSNTSAARRFRNEPPFSFLHGGGNVYMRFLY